MTYKLLVGVYGDAISTLEFDPAAQSVKVTAESNVSPNPSWIAEGKGGLYGISEAEPGLVTQLQKEGDSVKETSKKETGGGPAHVLVTSKGDVVVSNYVGGSVFWNDKVIPLPYVYKDKTPPNPSRQDASHAHHALEYDGRVFVCDLGSDKVWILTDGEITDAVSLTPGSGPRHALVHDDKLYVLGELDGNVYSTPVPSKASATHTGDKMMLPVSAVSYVPPCVEAQSAHAKDMLGAELLLHDGKLLASNRRMLHHPIKDTGDAIAVIPLEGGKMQNPSWIRTGCCCIRGLSISPDGKYAAVGGQCNNLVEIYETGEKWRKVAQTSVNSPVAFLWL